ncbi:hypothetical protein QBC38DRAFT_374645 [Podospora fimiseda]|uniref:Rhodopsin domain-containing protein n=1 Tax=Podospora fimiseda TaxID=252190 RepID=A0AAN6YNS0_9PEZI|nr:hypothetical protein QBC38DRAFT_374645 [Podospora fimiseda]
MEAYSDFFLSLTPEQQESFLNMPFPAPEGVIPQVDNPPNNNDLAHAILALALFFSTCAMLLRAHARIFALKKIRIQDGLAIISFGCFVTCVYFMYRLMQATGFWVHQWNLRIRVNKEAFLVLHYSTNFYSAAMLCIKAAILIEWITIFSPNGVRDKFWWACSITLFLNTLFYLAVIGAENYSCSPHRKIWDKLGTPGTCRVDGDGLMVAGSAFDVFSNLVILILPQVSIWRLRLSIAKRIGVSIVFAMGAFATAGVARRTAVSIKATKESDYTYLSSEIYMWAIVEMMFGFIVFAAPTIPLAFKHLGLFALASKVRSWGSSMMGSRKYKSSVTPMGQADWPLENTQNSGQSPDNNMIPKRQSQALKYDKYGIPITDMSGATQVDYYYYYYY